MTSSDPDVIRRQIEDTRASSATTSTPSTRRSTPPASSTVGYRGQGHG